MDTCCLACLRLTTSLQLNNVLKAEGVQMFYIAGDCATNSLFVVAHKVALEADLIYTHADGEGALMFDKAEFRAADPKDVFGDTPKSLAIRNGHTLISEMIDQA